MKNKKIKFVSSDNYAEITIEKPTPASQVLPDWWTKMPSSVDSGCPVRTKNDETIKACMPILDALGAGYVQRLWTDIHISDEGATYIYSQKPAPMIMREYKHNNRFPVPDGFYPSECAWQQPYIPQTSKGTSCLITHPMNRIDLPFFTMSGIIDTDSDLFVTWGQLPFFIRKGFTGIIPCGTPLYQIIPFQRDNWETEQWVADDRYRMKCEANLNKHFVGGYKKLYRKPKYWL